MAELAAAGGFQLAQQIGENSVAPLVLDEVVVDAGEERFFTDPRNQLLEHRATLGVGDSIEVNLNILDVADVGNNRVGGGQLVLPVSPALFHGVERGPRVGPLGCLRGSDGGGPLGEGFVEPEVVPPAHGH